MTRSFLAILAVMCTYAQATVQSRLELRREIEENKPILLATLTADGKPVEDATITFSAARTFGSLVLAQEKTLDDGTAATAFPADLPGGESGILHLTAEFKGNDKVAAARIEQTFTGGRKLPAESLKLPAALWSPRAPVLLVVTVAVLMAGVWLSYAYVAMQIVGIKKGAKS